MKSQENSGNHYGEVLQTTDVVTVLDEIQDERGINLRRVHVDDVSETSPTRHDRQAAIALNDEQLRANPDWTAPQLDSKDRSLILNNPVSEWVYEGSPAMYEWHSALIPTAEALVPMQRPDITKLPIRTEMDKDGNVVDVRGGGPIDEVARSFFTDALDSIGLRTRAKIMTEIARGYIDAEEDTTWVSLACGAAIPVLEALKSIKNDNHQVHLQLVDIDRGTLSFARQLALEEGLEEGRDFTPEVRNLVADMIISDSFTEGREESAMMVDALGILEYFNDKRSATFLGNAYKLVKPGGALVFANMLSDRQELEFNRRGIGWPKIYPRSLEEIIEITDNADLPPENVTITVPEDGVYAVIEVKK